MTILGVFFYLFISFYFIIIIIILYVLFYTANEIKIWRATFLKTFFATFFIILIYLFIMAGVGRGCVVLAFFS